MANPEKGSLPHEQKQPLPGGHGKTPIGAYFSPGIFVDGGGIIIYPGRDGKIHVKHVPPWQPVLGGLSQIATLIAEAETSNSPQTSEQLRNLAASKAEEVASAIATLEVE